MSLGWEFQNEAGWGWWINETKIVQWKKNPDDKSEVESDNVSYNDKYSAVS